MKHIITLMLALCSIITINAQTMSKSYKDKYIISTDKIYSKSDIELECLLIYFDLDKDNIKDIKFSFKTNKDNNISIIYMSFSKVLEDESEFRCMYYINKDLIEIFKAKQINKQTFSLYK